MEPKVNYIFVAGHYNVANHFALDMLSRHLRIFRGKLIWRFYESVVPFIDDALKVELYEPNRDDKRLLPLYTSNKVKQNFFLTKQDHELGKRFLSDIGVPDDGWFAGIHTRDSSYLKKALPGRNWDYHDFRDAPISTYLEAANHIVSSGGHALRMGAVVEEPLPQHLHSNIIDYATKFRTDFLDVYLLATCKFFLGSSAGLFCLPAVFERPLAYANGLPACSPWGKFTMFIPKKLLLEKEGRYLSFREIFDRYGAKALLDGKTYHEAGVSCVPNTAEEVRDLCIELNDIIDGRAKPNDALKKHLSQSLGPNHPWSVATSYLGTRFVEQNKEMFEL